MGLHSKSKSKSKTKKNPSATGAGPSIDFDTTKEKAPTPKRPRPASEEFEEDESEHDQDILIDSFLGCLTKDESLLDHFIAHLLAVPQLQEKLITKVTDIMKTNVDVQMPRNSTANSLKESVDKLTGVVKELQSDLEISKNRNDDLEQYSRRNNIVISGLPVRESSDLETQVCNLLSTYTGEPILSKEIDRVHRVYRNNHARRSPADRPPDVLVKFMSYKSKANILTKDPMEALRSDNQERPEKERIYIREDLTKARANLFFKTRRLKKLKRIKDTFTRDGKIIIKLNQITRPKYGHGKDQKEQKYYINNEDELLAFCEKYKVNIGDLDSEGEAPMDSELLHVVRPTSKDAADSPKPSSSSASVLKPLDPKAKTFSPLFKGTAPIVDLYRDVLIKDIEPNKSSEGSSD